MIGIIFIVLAALGIFDILMYGGRSDGREMVLKLLPLYEGYEIKKIITQF